MTPEEVLGRTTTPLSCPAWPSGPFVSSDVESLDIIYRSDPDVLRHLVPEPLTVREPLVRFQIMRMPDTTGLGDHATAGQSVMVECDGVQGYYLDSMYLDSLPALALGRETVGFPKKLGSPRLYHDIDTLVGTLDYGSLRIATATMGFKHTPLNTEDAHADATAPTFIVKIGHSFDGTVNECQLVRLPFKDLTVTGAWSGPARLELFAHALAPIADLPVKGIISARHTTLTAMQYGPPASIHDYLV